MITTLVFSHDDMPALLKDAYPNSTSENRERYAKPLLESALKWQIHSPLRLSHWLAQLGHESGELKYSEEISSGRAYEGRRSLGNTQPGDGVRFKGRGLTQLTGRYNYTRFSRALGMPEILANPKLVAELPFSVEVSGWYWMYGASVNLNSLADKDNVTLITKLINGGYNGLADRKRLLSLCKKAVDRHGTLKVQTALNALSARGSRWPSLKVDGAFGPQTTSVVREMQAEYAIKPTGDVDIKTWNKLKELAA